MPEFLWNLKMTDFVIAFVSVCLYESKSETVPFMLVLEQPLISMSHNISVDIFLILHEYFTVRRMVLNYSARCNVLGIWH